MQQNKYSKQNIKVQDLGHYFRSLTSIVDDFSGDFCPEAFLDGDPIE